jgi:hypothetical protein
MFSRKSAELLENKELVLLGSAKKRKRVCMSVKEKGIAKGAGEDWGSAG